MREFIAWALSVWPILTFLFIGAVAISGWIIGHDFSHPKKGTTKNTPFDLIIPKLQVTPSDIRDDNIATTAMMIYVLNCSDYVAKHISMDIKFGNSLWKHDLWKAASIDVDNKLLAGKDDPLMAEILSKNSEQELKEMLRNYLDHPILDELKPGGKIKVYMFDVNKEWALKEETFWASGGKLTPIKPEKARATKRVKAGKNK